ncbi:hypothetical protein K9L67_00570 [Candidatus Woesearchaeota archaeon]|nr:hypothetical protein [Candidatus Woesearchaeota archaeon]MCF7900700.1 hypothetical protein [Candidatus Woesearchaeota archaeon]MCF8013221.1 hypothetical protein [Candidatus Woesearchaeota archaeon]
MENKDIGGSFYQGNNPGFSGQNPFTSKNVEIQSLNKTLSEISSNLRILEDRYYNLRKKIQLTDQALLDTQRSFFKEKRILGDDLIQTKMVVQELSEQIDLMRLEIVDAVKQKDFKVLEKYLDLWDPMQFVTRKEVDDLIEENERDEQDE